MKKNILSSDIYWLEECIKSIPYGEATLKVVIHNRKVKYTVRASSQTVLAEDEPAALMTQVHSFNNTRK